jgi:hypothetical protein
MTAAIVDDGIPDDLGQAGVGVLADSNAERAYQIKWHIRNARLVVEIGETISAAEVVAMLGRQDERNA